MLDIKLINFPKILDKRGNLSFLENNSQVPFDIKRVYWIYDVPGGEKRGGHVYSRNQELIVALSGSFDVILHDGKTKNRISLNRSYTGLYVPNKIWRQMDNFSTNSLALVLASTFYDKEDYIYEFDQFLELVK